VTPPPAVVIGKDGKPVKAPKVCMSKDIADAAAKVAKATAQAAPLNRAAAKLREASAALRAQAAKNPSQALIAKAGQLSCLVPAAPGNRF
jgi:hypothetical protein